MHAHASQPPHQPVPPATCLLQTALIVAALAAMCATAAATRQLKWGDCEENWRWHEEDNVSVCV